jgi:hypothetical protein
LLASFTCTGTHAKPSQQARRRDVRDFAWTMRQLVGGPLAARGSGAIDTEGMTARRRHREAGILTKRAEVTTSRSVREWWALGSKTRRGGPHGARAQHCNTGHCEGGVPQGFGKGAFAGEAVPCGGCFGPPSETAPAR